MKSITKTVLLLFFPVLSIAQEKSVDSLKSVYQSTSNDSVLYVTGRALYNYYEELNRDSALYYADQILLLARKNNKQLVEVFALDSKGYQLLQMGHYSESLQCLLHAFDIVENPKNNKEETWPTSTEPSPGKTRVVMLAITHHMMGVLMWQTQNSEQQIFHFKEARRIAGEVGNQVRLLLADMMLGTSYLIIGKLDSSLIFAKEAERIVLQTGIRKRLGTIFSILGEVYMNKGDYVSAKKYFDQGVQLSIEQNNMSSLSRNYLRLVRCYLAERQKDSALNYALKNLQTIRSLGPILGLEANIGTAYENVYLSYKLRNQVDSAYKYQGLALAAKDSINKIRIKNLAEFQSLSFNEQMRLQNLEKEKVIYQNKIRTYFLLAGIAILLLLAIFFYINNRQKHKAKIKIEQAYNDLKATQQQLIQSEKMASLGELTAGIAHEIQNPLNFVNNFSEVSNELVDEMKDELLTGKEQEAIVIADNVKQNLGKILHHGKRADAIVKGMLQHSRKSDGAKEPTNINALAEEYLRLSYHGLRAKDKTFNATLQTDFDESIGKINIIPQDIGRVLLNLYNNAFYTVSEKKKSAGDSYQPMVSISTKKENNKVEIRVKDNGNGIPQKVLDKIFQPFFTTKPTGQGTGLGLSLSYDIVKAHGGEISVHTEEGEGSEFIIQIIQ